MLQGLRAHTAPTGAQLVPQQPYHVELPVTPAPQNPNSFSGLGGHGLHLQKPTLRETHTHIYIILKHKKKTKGLRPKAI